jgi:1-aminocyclopropane-1-carboxylate deaminase
VVVIDTATAPTPLQRLTDTRLERAGVTLWIKRDDLIHPGIPGNKWRKLKHNLEAARAQGADTLLTFGGAFSNHIYATANAGAAFGFRTIGLIRGERHDPLNPVLQHATNCGMELHYVSRDEYRLKHTAEFQRELARFGDHVYVLPEGGSNDLAVRGCAEIIDEIDMPFDAICCAVGTGGTLAGLIAGLSSHRDSASALGVSALKGGGFLREDVRNLLARVESNSGVAWDIALDYHFGGFARVKRPLVEFVTEFNQQHDFELDPIYTGKMMFGLFDLIERGRWPSGSTVIAVHTGGAPRAHWASLLD